MVRVPVQSVCSQNQRFAFRTFPWSKMDVFPARSIILAILEDIAASAVSACASKYRAGRPVSGERASRL